MPDYPVAPLSTLDCLALQGRDNDPALILRDGVLTYNQLKDRVATLAGWLRLKVPQTGERVATWAAKGELTCLMPLAAARAGLVHVPINPLLKRAQIAHILADSGARILIGTGSRLQTLHETDLPGHCQTTDEAEVVCGYQAAQRVTSAPGAPADLAAILYTSGSTGKPKGVMLSHANMWLGAESVARYLGLNRDDRALAVLPLSFDYGQNQLLSHWYAGASAVPLDYLTPRDVVKAVGLHGATTLAAVPPLWIQLTEIDWPEDAVASLRRLTNSGGALSADLVRKLRAKFPDARLFPMYGLTEAFRSTFLDPDLVDANPTSIGKAIPHAEVLVIDDEGNLAGDDEEGELVHCGPLVAQGYWRDAERTAERFREAPSCSSYGGVAVWSGDRVRRDGRGLLTFVGRRDAMIKSAGNRISPQEIEEAALASGFVSEAVAVGVKDERLGEAVHLVVRGTPRQREATQELRSILLKELPNFMQPAAIHWREKLPLSANGKIDRVGLAAELAA